MPDKYINATKLIERLKCEKRREVAEAANNPFSTGPAPEIRISQIYDGVVSVLEKEPAANVVPRPAPKWPICQMRSPCSNFGCDENSVQSRNCLAGHSPRAVMA